MPAIPVTASASSTLRRRTAIWTPELWKTSDNSRVSQSTSLFSATVLLDLIHKVLAVEFTDWLWEVTVPKSGL